MLIQPVQPVYVLMKIGEDEFLAQLISLSEEKLELKCEEYFEKDIEISFYAKHFRGQAIIQEIKFAHSFFTYQLLIQEIQFQPGLLINTRL
ncbi:hypothetical protein OQJ18_11910 [Fluoribacter dumoffii]|uniref:Uncharacterized protein n=1 Tax=Fluoribacter dumoffii TaxID=463 RepID=A0A377G6D3_9GAMM|nr:hypothetical protein [Fluoribacter dumoffii]KTC91584.1 hypothetical protein Ldum_2652 [Fluoribacter dumoffii NY 23]MCW8387292.1 hypothetical protein [Fluoribacter dumoffii]MCW8417202.1 hypothetical protein [Fluoribacter dumoffii]MCW8454958.1 hypothetical protein [Fluoribacter dumoffii]MCW8460965.1 hypothetical protein [Fluoribacter dumoffii]